MEELLAKLKVPPDAAAAELYQSVQPLRQMVAFQAAFVAGCCQQAMELGTSKLQEKFAFTWQLCARERESGQRSRRPQHTVAAGRSQQDILPQ